MTLQNVVRRRTWAICSLMLLATSASATSLASSASAAPVTKVKLATTATTAAAAYQIGIKKGFFRKEGISLSFSTKVPAPQLTGAVIGGQQDFALISSGVLAAVVSNGAPLTAIAQATIGGNTAKTDDLPLVTLASSKIKSAKDLQGKTVGLPALRGGAEVAVRYAVSKVGNDKSVKFAAVNFNDMPAALRAGRIDAAVLSEPYLALLKSQTKVRTVMPLVGSQAKDAPVTLLVTNNSYLNKNKKIVDAMRRASVRTIRYAAKHPREVRAQVPTTLGVPNGIAKTMILSRFDPVLQVKKLQRLADLAYKYGVIRSRPNMSKYVKLG